MPLEKGIELAKWFATAKKTVRNNLFQFAFFAILCGIIYTQQKLKEKDNANNELVFRQLNNHIDYLRARHDSAVNDCQEKRLREMQNLIDKIQRDKDKVDRILEEYKKKDK